MNELKENKLSFYNFIFLWFGAAVSIAEILTGGFIAPLGFKLGFVAIVLGHLIGTVILVLAGLIGSREKVPAITSTRMSFGLYGTYIFSILNVLQLIGWTAVMIKSGASSINGISNMLWKFDNQAIWSLVIGGLIILWIVFGKNGLKKITTVSVTLLFILTIVLGFIIFKDGSVFNSASTGEMSFGAALELSVVMPISWIPLIADYTRFAKSDKGGAYGSFIGYFVGSCWMYVIGLGAAIVSGNPDPSAIMLAVNLGVIGLGIVLLSTVTTTFLDAYSAGVTFLNIMPKLDEKKISVIMTVIGIGAALLVPMENYESFLYAIGSVFAPLFAIVIADYFIIGKNRKVEEKLIINFGSTLIWVLGVILYNVMMGIDLPLGSTVPVMLITGIVYTISWKGISNWKLIRK
ncbi:putative hydroxymethylpyrimidine transporter CytX [Clostridium sp. DL1XJH146]